MARNGLSCAKASALAVITPTITPPIRPGPAGGGDAVEIGEIEAGRRPARPRPARRCARDGRARRSPAPRRRSGDARSAGYRRRWPGSGRRAAAAGRRLDDGDGRLVAARFDAQDAHACLLASAVRPTLEQRHGGSPRNSARAAASSPSPRPAWCAMRWPQRCRRWPHPMRSRSSSIKTTGDAIQDRPLSEAGGKGLFVKEIEEALLSASHRRRRAQHEGHADGAAAGPRDRGLPAARGCARRADRGRRQAHRRSEAGRDRRHLGAAPARPAPAPPARPADRQPARQRRHAAAPSAKPAKSRRPCWRWPG